MKISEIIIFNEALGLLCILYGCHGSDSTNMYVSLITFKRKNSLQQIRKQIICQS